MARNIVGLWTLTQTNGAIVVIDIDRVEGDGAFNLEANHSNGAVMGTGSGRILNEQVHFNVLWNNETHGAYNGAFADDGFINGAAFDIRNPGVVAGWRSNRAFF